MTATHFYPGTRVLRNKFGITNAAFLAEVEEAKSAIRMAELARDPIAGRFDFDHLREIHRAILSDVYDWAGQPRTVPLDAGDLVDHHERNPEAIAGEAERIFSEIADANFLRGLDREQFTESLAGHWGDLTGLHAFLDGNSRSQRVFVDQLAREAGWAVDWRELTVPAVQAARNVAALVGGGEILTDVITPAIKPADEIPASALIADPRPDTMTVAEHWDAMLEHVMAETGEPYTWPGAPATQPEPTRHRQPEAEAAPDHHPNAAAHRPYWTPEHAHNPHMPGHLMPPGMGPEGPSI